MVSHPLKDFIVRFKPGERIFRQGDSASEMYIVQSGSVEIYREGAKGEQVLAVMEKGDFFGEMSVLEGTPRTASARAAENSEVIEITSAIFDRMIRGNIEIAVRMLRKLSSRLQEAQAGIGGRAVDPMQDRVEAPKPSQPLRVVHEAAAAASGSAGERLALPADCLGALILGDGEQIFPIRGDICLIGRYDPVTGTRPEIDLTPYDTNRSVSRRHARVTANGPKLFISEEVGALNGTFLNGKRLSPGKAEPFQAGDTLALGMVLLKLKKR